MEPFAVQKPRKLRGPWLVVGLTAAAFAVWQFDLLPRVRSGATGSVRESGDLAGDGIPSLAESLDQITDADAGQAESDLSVSEADLNRSRHDRRVHPASFEVSGSTNTVGAEFVNGRDATDARAAVDADPASDSARPSDSETPLVIPAALAEQLRQIDRSIRDDQVLEAHEELSRLYWKRPDYRSLIGARIAHTAGLIYSSPDQHFGEPFSVQFGDTLDSIAGQYGLTWQYLAQLNRLTPEKLRAGQQLKVVRGPFSGVIDLQEFTLTIHAHGWYVHHYRIGIGRGESTPVGEFTVLNKLENPVWYNPDGGVVDADDPTNPLGEYWLGLGDHIGIHGTTDPNSIGRSVSRGCIHMADSDIAEVFQLLSIGSPVTIRKSATGRNPRVPTTAADSAASGDSAGSGDSAASGDSAGSGDSAASGNSAGSVKSAGSVNSAARVKSVGSVKSAAESRIPGRAAGSARTPAADQTE